MGEEKRDIDQRGGGGRVRSLIEKATTSPIAVEIDPRLLKAIKSVVRSSDSEIQLAVQTLMSNMKTKHSQVRYLALLIVDELFMRSKLFRSLLVVNLDQFLSLSIGFRANMPLPAPPSIASRLRSKALEFLEKWNATFGIHYRQLRLGVAYLKNLRYQFPNIQQNAARLQSERREREMRSKEILLNKFETLRQNLSSIKNEIQTAINEVCECLDILRPKDDDLTSFAYDEEDEFGEYKCSALQQIRLAALKEGEKFHEDNDNKVICDALREMYKLVVTKHMVTVQEWISVLLRVEPEDTRFKDCTLKEFIDVLNRLKSVKEMCEQSGCDLTGIANQEDEDIWEECEVEVECNNVTSSTLNKPSGGLAQTSIVGNGKTKKYITPGSATVSSGSQRSNGDGNESESTPVRRKLLTEAPVMTWGSFLDNWGINRDILANQRGLELEGHWGRVDYDAVIPAEKIAELNVQATLYKEEQLEIQPCLAPLRKGGLCQRRDKKVCPFHGPIIPRDAEGNPIQQSSTDAKSLGVDRDDTILDADIAVVQQLAKQAIKNVRARDRDEAKMRENDRLLKRAKLAKVREHNEAVLREAAMASTSRSQAFGEDVEAEAPVGPRHKKKEPTLASMLRKKITTKDRLAGRLLSTRARDATTRQLTSGEDERYREAFPNQW